jgi:hypothetical protein
MPDTAAGQQDATDRVEAEMADSEDQHGTAASEDTHQARRQQAGMVDLPLTDLDLGLEHVLVNSLEKMKRCETAGERISIIRGCIAELESIAKLYSAVERAA